MASSVPVRRVLSRCDMVSLGRRGQAFYVALGQVSAVRFRPVGVSFVGFRRSYGLVWQAWSV